MLPVLYSFRRCPYAIRARLAMAMARVDAELREIILRDKPAAMLAASAKGTVPVLVLPDGDVIDESLDIMRWALAQNDPENWCRHMDTASINSNDGAFKAHLDKYKYASRHPEADARSEYDAAIVLLTPLEDTVGRQPFLGGNRRSFTDAAIFPFVRQFAAVDPTAFARDLPALEDWRTRWQDTPLFARVMAKQPLWLAGTVGSRFQDVYGELDPTAPS